MLSSLSRAVGKIVGPLWFGWLICWLWQIPVWVFCLFAVMYAVLTIRSSYRHPQVCRGTARVIVGHDPAGHWWREGDRIGHTCEHAGAVEVWTNEVPGVAPGELVAHWCDRCKTQLPWDWTPAKRKVTIGLDGGIGYQNVGQLAAAIRASGVTVEQIRAHWLAQARGEPQVTEVNWAVDLAGNRHPLGSALWPAPTEAERRAGEEVAGLILPGPDGVIRAPADRDVEGMYRADTREAIEAAGYDAVCVPDLIDPPGCEHHAHVRGARRAS